MKAAGPRGLVYVCPVCHAEVTVVGSRMGAFHPRCCNRDMVPVKRAVRFYRCPVCDAEVAVLRGGKGDFVPRCCNTGMVLLAA